MEWWAHSFGWGSLAALACGAVLIAVEFIAPYAFLNDYPADIRERAPKPTPMQRRTGNIGGLVFVLTLFAGVSSVVWAWGATHPDAGFVELALMALVVFVLFAIFDIVVIDWLTFALCGRAALSTPAPNTARAGATTDSTSKNNSARALCSS